jgi:hypothetical protein
MSEHKEIWLSPQCPQNSEAECGHPEEIFADAVGGRMWCEDEVWGACPKCGAHPARYVIAKESAT